ncbi:MAG: hypothetical protein ABI718_09400 [Acidobacteriota bacterium]
MSEKETKTATRGNESRSNGSNKEWLTGETGQTVGDGSASGADVEFYDSRHDANTASESEHTRTSPLAKREESNPSPPGGSENIPRQPA